MAANTHRDIQLQSYTRNDAISSQLFACRTLQHARRSREECKGSDQPFINSRERYIRGRPELCLNLLWVVVELHVRKLEVMHLHNFNMPLPHAAAIVERE